MRVTETIWPNWIDLVILILVFRGCYVGFCREWWTELLHLVGVVAVSVFTCHFYVTLVEWLSPWWRFDPYWLEIAGVGALFVIAMVLVHLGIRRFSALIPHGQTRWLGHGMGMGVGGLRGAWWAGLTMLFMLSLQQPYLMRSVAERSLLGPRLVAVSRTTLRWLVDRVPGRPPETRQSRLLRDAPHS